MSEQLQSVFGGSLHERVKRHAGLVNEIRCAYISERRRRLDSQQVPHSVSCQLLNVSNMAESLWSTMNRLEIDIEEAEREAAPEEVTRKISEIHKRAMAGVVSAKVARGLFKEDAEREAERPPMSDLGKHVFDTANAINRFAVEQLRAEREAAPEEVNHA